MSKPLKPRRGTTAEQNAFVGEAYEVTYDTDKNTLVCRDGLTAGGFPLAKEGDLNAIKTSQSTRDAEQDAAIAATEESVTTLDDTLRALIAEEVAKLLALDGSRQMTGAIQSTVSDAIAFQHIWDSRVLAFGIGSSGTNRGIYDETEQAWQIYSNADGNTYLQTLGENKKALSCYDAGNLRWDGNLVIDSSRVAHRTKTATATSVSVTAPSGGTWLYLWNGYNLGNDGDYSHGGVGTCAGGASVTWSTSTSSKRLINAIFIRID